VTAVKLYVKTNKNDYIDAEIIAEAVGRPKMRFVPIKGDTDWAIWPNRSDVSGVKGEGLITIVLPVMRAGATFHRARSTGKFQGVIAPTTPSGVWCNSTNGAARRICLRLTDPVPYAGPQHVDLHRSQLRSDQVRAIISERRRPVLPMSKTMARSRTESCCTNS
jgi:hypothetical protein